jgi:hypothetical protein
VAKPISAESDVMQLQHPIPFNIQSRSQLSDTFDSLPMTRAIQCPSTRYNLILKAETLIANNSYAHKPKNWLERLIGSRCLAGIATRVASAFHVSQSRYPVFYTFSLEGG